MSTKNNAIDHAARFERRRIADAAGIVVEGDPAVVAVVPATRSRRPPRAASANVMSSPLPARVVSASQPAIWLSTQLTPSLAM